MTQSTMALSRLLGFVMILGLQLQIEFVQAGHEWELLVPLLASLVSPSHLISRLHCIRKARHAIPSTVGDMERKESIQS